MNAFTNQRSLSVFWILHTHCPSGLDAQSLKQTKSELNTPEWTWWKYFIEKPPY